MALKKREYKIYKKHMDEQLRHGFYMNPEIYTSLKDRKGWPPLNVALKLLAAMIKDENFEAAKAISDSIKEFAAEKGFPIPDNATFILPEIEAESICCHISYARGRKPGL